MSPRTWPSLLVASFVLLAATYDARAAEKAGVRMADSLAVHGQTLQLNGLGVREATIFNIDVYVAGLYLPQRTSNVEAILRADQPKVLHLVFVHDVDRKKIAEAWSEGFEKNAGARLSGLRDRVEQLTGAMVDLKPGSSLTFGYAPDQGVEVAVNGLTKVVIKGSDFAEVLFAIWLGPNPPNRGLKTGLLGR